MKYRLLGIMTDKHEENLPFKIVYVKMFLLELGLSTGVIKYICLVFMDFHAVFYFYYIYYFDLLIFCCQNVATVLVQLYLY